MKIIKGKMNTTHLLTPYPQRSNTLFAFSPNAMTDHSCHMDRQILPKTNHSILIFSQKSAPPYYEMTVWDQQMIWAPTSYYRPEVGFFTENSTAAYSSDMESHSLLQHIQNHHQTTRGFALHPSEKGPYIKNSRYTKKHYQQDFYKII
ncbi:hypothetical protein [Burkholderia contaminans]|uniref:hypothetical protein n=1 Tax=Burkholderia contaminans TaxID=488447 RepID=UPI000F59C633|nr:hypothetical protein [Burkholderia contaminans]